MSEPLSTNDIEDVVSSVRRLVSPEARPRPLSRDLGLEKLILTPALLVAPDPYPAAKRVAKPSPKPKAKPAAPAKTGRKTVAPKADPIRTEPAAPVVEAEWEAPFWAEPEPALAEMALQAEEAVLMTSPEPAATVTAATVTAATSARKPRSAPKAPAKKAAAAGRSPSQPAPKGANSTLRSVKPATEPRKTAERPAPVAVKPALELVRSEPEVSAPHALVPDPAVVNVAASPVEPVADLQADPPAEFETAAPTALEEELVVNGLAQVLTDRDGNPVSLLDEDELILMVRRVIREELQDVLGERITRNVRKLVRAEINRALTLQTLE